LVGLRIQNFARIETHKSSKESRGFRKTLKTLVRNHVDGGSEILRSDDTRVHSSPFLTFVNCIVLLYCGYYFF